GLAEAAAADTAAHHLDGYAVVDDVDVRDDLALERRDGVQVTHDPFAYGRLGRLKRANLTQGSVLRIFRGEKSGDVYPGNAAQRPQQVRPVFPVPGKVGVANVKDGFFAVAQ